MFIEVVTIYWDEDEKDYQESDTLTLINLNTVFMVTEAGFFNVSFVNGESLEIKRQREGGFPDCVEVR